MPPAGSAAIFSIAVRTFGFASALFIAPFSWTTTSFGVPVFTRMPNQSWIMRSREACLGDRRHVLERGQPGRAGHHQRAGLPGGNQFKNRKWRNELKLVHATHQVWNGLRQALVRHVRRLRAGLQLEHFTGEMCGRAEAARQNVILFG